MFPHTSHSRHARDMQRLHHAGSCHIICLLFRAPAGVNPLPLLQHLPDALMVMGLPVPEPLCPERLPQGRFIFGEEQPPSPSHVLHPREGVQSVKKASGRWQRHADTSLIILSLASTLAPLLSRLSPRRSLEQHKQGWLHLQAEALHLFIFWRGSNHFLFIHIKVSVFTHGISTPALQSPSSRQHPAIMSKHIQVRGP